MLSFLWQSSLELHPQYKNVQDFHTMWNRCLRRILHVSNKTHVRYLPHLSGIPHSTSQMFSRFLKMVHCMLASENTLVRFIAKNGQQDSDSIIGKNLQHISRMTLKNRWDILRHCNVRELDVYPCTPHDLITIKTIKELICSNIPQWQKEEIEDFVDFICIS